MSPAVRRRSPLLQVLLSAGAAGLVLAACSSSPSASTSSTAPRSTTTSPSTTSTTGSPSTTSTTDPAGSSTTTSTAGFDAFPAVANATNLKVEPIPSAGSGTPPTALETKDLVVGTGPTASPSSTVTVQYVGANWANGTVFDSSWSRGQAFTTSLAQVVPGFEEGVAGMKVGGRREIIIPPALGYGSQGTPEENGTQAVGPNETLIFIIDLLSVQQ